MFSVLVAVGFLSLHPPRYSSLQVYSLSGDGDEADAKMKFQLAEHIIEWL